MVTVKQIINKLEQEKILKEHDCNDDIKIEFLSYDSRNIKPNTMFFCKGEHYKVEYLTQSIEKGATVYVSEIKYDVNVPYIIVTDIQKAMAIVAMEFYGYAFKSLTTVGVTGTKGKTTVTTFINTILNEYAKRKTAIISSINTYTGSTDELSHLTTPEALDLQRLLWEAKQNDCKFVTMEVSSQGYKKDRVYGIEFDNGLFLNIGEDHISSIEHPNFEDYLHCKMMLLKNSKNVIINKNTDYYDVIYSECKDKNVITYGTDDSADYYYTNVKKTESGFVFDVRSKNNDYFQTFYINMPGRFNIENALSAIVVSKNMGVDDESIKNGLLNTIVKGRMNVFEKDGITVVVDYAHNGLSYTKLYESLKLDYPNRRIISVGGCVGGKAYNRRGDFGRIVGGNSDYVYLTAVDPQYEKVEDICKDIALHIEDKSKYEIIPNRKTAVEKALSSAKPGDVVVLVGKGEEEYQKVNGVCEKYESDLAIAKKFLNVK